MIQTDIRELNEKIQRESEFIDLIRLEMDKVIVGQKYMVERLLIGLLSNGHILLEGVPGLAKTLAINSLARIIDAKFSRIQFTPDLLPADLIGTMIYSQKSEDFVVRKGPIFANFILADEINRSPAKVQSALLEAMQERQVTIGQNTFKLEEPFLVMATQNPIEQEGTYPLPEAQQDRFMFNIYLDYPSFKEEVDIVKTTIHGDMNEPKQILSCEEIIFYQKLLQKVPIAENVYEYAVRLVTLTRPFTGTGHQWAKDYLAWGAGPRASQFLIVGARTHAILNGKLSPDIEDVRAVAHNILRHRIIKNYKAEAEGISVDDIIQKLLYE
jgi:MoxR-like ATPase